MVLGEAGVAAIYLGLGLVCGLGWGGERGGKGFDGEREGKEARGEAHCVLHACVP